MSWDKTEDVGDTVIKKGGEWKMDDLTFIWLMVVTWLAFSLGVLYLVR